MPSYCVRVIGPAGRETYLNRGTEVSSEEEASHYPSLEIAEDNKYFYFAYLKRLGQNVFLTIQKVGDPEWGNGCV